MQRRSGCRIFCRWQRHLRRPQPYSFSHVQAGIRQRQEGVIGYAEVEDGPVPLICKSKVWTPVRADDSIASRRRPMVSSADARYVASGPFLLVPSGSRDIDCCQS